MLSIGYWLSHGAWPVHVQERFEERAFPGTNEVVPTWVRVKDRRYGTWNRNSAADDDFL